MNSHQYLVETVRSSPASLAAWIELGLSPL